MGWRQLSFSLGCTQEIRADVAVCVTCQLSPKTWILRRHILQEALWGVHSLHKCTRFTPADVETTPHTHTHTHSYTHHTTACWGGCCQGSERASWLVASAHHWRNSPAGLVGCINEAFQDVFSSAALPTAGSLICFIISTHCSSSLICLGLCLCFFVCLCCFLVNKCHGWGLGWEVVLLLQICPYYHVNHEACLKWSVFFCDSR